MICYRKRVIRCLYVMMSTVRKNQIMCHVFGEFTITFSFEIAPPEAQDYREGVVDQAKEKAMDSIDDFDSKIRKLNKVPTIIIRFLHSSLLENLIF